MSYDDFLTREQWRIEREQEQALGRAIEDGEICSKCFAEIDYKGCLWCHPEDYLQELLRSALQGMKVQPFTIETILKVSSDRGRFKAEVRRFYAAYLWAKRSIHHAALRQGN